jgi:Ser/Thr protein kinase RdoA (MazF antagonist)/uncharacterized protein YkwD
MKIKILILFVTAAALISGARPASAAPPVDKIDTAVEIIVLINTYRQELGLPPYTYDPTLMAVAQAHTEYQVSIGESTHVGEGGSTSSQRAAAGGYAGGEFAWINEMIYTGQYATPEKAIEWWKNSPIHNEIMTSDVYHQIGVGVAESETHKFYTVNVGAIPDITSPGTPGVLGPDTNQVRGDITGASSTQQPPEQSPTQTTTPTESSVVDTSETADDAQPSSENTALLTGEGEIAAGNDTQADQQPAAASQTKWGLWIGLGGLGIAALGTLVLFTLRSKEMDEEIEEYLDDQYSDFFNLSRDEQFNRLQIAARQALEVYPLEVISIEPLRYVLNAEFLVQAFREGRGDQPGQFVVRVNAPGFHSPIEIRSELEWLAALNQDTGLKVPNPLRTRRGEWVKTIELDLLDGPRHCVVFEYIPGQTIEAEATPEHLAIVGGLIAQLHRHGANFEPPADFTRKHWDLNGLKGGMLDVPNEKAYHALSEEELRVVRAAEQVVETAMGRLGRGAQVYGLIHADLHLKSFLFDGDEPLVLDFDTCGYGCYIYDLAVVVWNLFDREDFALLRKALLEGYRGVRHLSQLEEQHLVHFIAGRLMTQTLAWAARRGDPGLAKQADTAIKRQTQLLELLIRMYAE